MNKRKTASILAVLFILLIGLLFFINKEYLKHENLQSIKYENIDKVIECFKEKNYAEFSQEVEKNATKEINKILSNSNDKLEIINAYIAKGIINLEENNIKEGINSLKKAEENLEYMDDELKSFLYYQISKAYIYDNDFEMSKLYFDKVKDIFQEGNNKELVIKYILFRHGDLYNANIDMKEALVLLEEALKVAEEIKYDRLDRVYFALGRVYWSLGRTLEAAKANIKALEISKEKNIKTQTLFILSEIGTNYVYSENYSTAKKYFEESLNFNYQDGDIDIEQEFVTLTNLAEVSWKLEEYHDLKKYIDLTDNCLKKINDTSLKEDFIAVNNIHKAIYEIGINNCDKALKYIKLAEKTYKSKPNFIVYDFDLEIYKAYGELYYKLKDYDKAIKYHNKVRNAVKDKKELYYVLEDINKKLYLDYKAKKNYKKCNEYLEENSKIQRQKREDENKWQDQYLRNEFELEKQENEIKSLKENKYIMISTIVILIVITLLISIFTYTIYKKNKEINRLNKLFRDLSVTDSLTKVQNRRALDEYLSGNWDLYKKTSMPISFMMIDIDCFKKYNDNYGHPKGDIVLEKVANTIKSTCRSSDFVARYGGEEFIIIMLNSDKNESINLAQRIINNVQNLNIEHKYSYVSDKLTISMGICTAYVENVKDYDDYIKKSDDALYKAKEQGRNQYVYL